MPDTVWINACNTTRPRYRLDWATLLNRTFALDVLHCDRCGGRRKLCALISEETIAQKILGHLLLQNKAG